MVVMNKESSAKWDPQHAFAACAMMVIQMGCGICSADEQQQGKHIVPAKVEVRAKEILPSHDGEGYEGRFLFIHHGMEPLRIDCEEKPVGRRFLPNNVQFQVLKSGVWTQVETTGHGWCSEFDIPSGVPCELDVDLSPFKEEDKPLTGRVIFNWDKYPSEPFVLDWKSDREAGKFLAAKKAHAERLRAAFLKSGFRPELLNGDEFPLRIVKEMIASVTKSGDVGAWFGLIEGDIEISARIVFKGDVFIRFDSHHHGPGGYYWGFLRWHPDKLSRALIQKLRKADALASVMVDEKYGRPDGFAIWIDPDDPFDPETLEYIVRPFAMDLHLSLADDAALPMPTKEESTKAFDSAMDFLEGCLTK